MWIREIHADLPLTSLRWYVKCTLSVIFYMGRGRSTVLIFDKHAEPWVEHGHVAGLASLV